MHSSLSLQVGHAYDFEFGVLKAPCRLMSIERENGDESTLAKIAFDYRHIKNNSGIIVPIGDLREHHCPRQNLCAFDFNSNETFYTVDGQRFSVAEPPYERGDMAVVVNEGSTYRYNLTLSEMKRCLRSNELIPYMLDAIHSLEQRMENMERSHDESSFDDELPFE